MPDSFQSRISTLSEAELRRYAEQPLSYRTDAVLAAVAELARRGQALPAGQVETIQAQLTQRDAARLAEAPWRRHLGQDPVTRRTRVSRVTVVILGVGLGLAARLWWLAPPPAANPLGFEPEDSKKYLRQMEMIGGKANVVASQLQTWFDGLWHGRGLPRTVAVLTVVLAGTFWLSTNPGPPEVRPPSQP
ncbi:MAG: hypothetical protein NTW40_12305 [Acidobacteria bacterium]|nr:hypothetical protein [Acidobacteriota bacterium]